MNSTPTERARRINPRATAMTDALQVLGRVAIAPLFLLSGFAKLGDPEAFRTCIASAGLPFPTVALGAAILIELIGGVLLVVGYKTKAVAAIIAVFTLLSALIFENALGDQPHFLLFSRNIAITGGLMQIVAFGGGRWSIDQD